MTRVPLREAKDSLAKASTPEPFSTSRTSNWVARVGGLPDYVQHVAHDIHEKRGVPVSQAIQIAIGVIKRWARGGGNVDSGTRAAAAKAVAEWEAKKAANKAKVKEGFVPTLALERELQRAAMGRVMVLAEQFGVDGLVGLLGEGVLAEAAAWNPTLKRTASAPAEVERHEVYDGAQHVGTIARRRGYDAGRPDRWSAFAVNGTNVADFNTTKREDALKALQSHLAEAPARVISLATAGKFLVAQPQAYSGETTYRQFSNEAAARHAAGLPATPTVPERNSKVEQIAEMLRFDLMTLSALDVEPLRRVQEARRADPFDLTEAFHADELRGAHGRWVGRGATRTIAGRGNTRGMLSPLARMVGPGATDRPRARVPHPADERYRGGVSRASARLRAAHAAKPQIAKATDKRPEQALAAAVGSGAWDRSAADASRRLLAQPQMGMGEIERGVKAGSALDTETAHRTGPGGTYSAERQALHEHIIDLLLQGKGVHEGGKARAIFTAGGGASGKSAMIAAGAVHVPHDAVIANADVIREMLPEYKALKAAKREDAASLTHEEASHITKVVTRLALGRRHHVLIDGVGDSGPGKFAGKINDAIRAGHKVSVHYATVPTAEAIARADKRGQATGRYVDHGVLRSAHKSVSAQFAGVAKIRGAHVQVFDTSSGPNGERLGPRLMAETPSGTDKLVIRDRPGFQGFRDKANE